MSRIAVMTDSNSGMTQEEGREVGVRVLPMPFYIDGKLYFEDITLTQEQFYEKLAGGAEISTSQPTPGDILDNWNDLLKDHDEIIYIPMSSGLSGSCATATALAADFDGKVHVIDNQRISVTQRLSVYDALHMVQDGASGKEIADKLMATKFDSSIYIMVDTLKYLKKGGRLTPAAAAIGSLLRIKPVLTIQGEKLDAFRNARSVRQAKKIMIDAVKEDSAKRFGGEDKCVFHMAYTHNLPDLEEFRREAMAEIPGHPVEDFYAHPLSLSVSCHIGPGSLAITTTKKLFD